MADAPNKNPGKKKLVLLGLTSIAFVGSAYMTFFKPKFPAVDKKQAPAPFIGQKEQIRNLSPEDLEETDALLVSQEPDARFKPEIRDIFAPSEEFKQNKANRVNKKKKQIRPTLSPEEKTNISEAFIVNGTIINGGNAMAIINNQFFHQGDEIDGYQLVSIQETGVTIDTGRGIIHLEMIKKNE